MEMIPISLIPPSPRRNLLAEAIAATGAEKVLDLGFGGLYDVPGFGEPKDVTEMQLIDIAFQRGLLAPLG